MHVPSMCSNVGCILQETSKQTAFVSMRTLQYVLGTLNVSLPSLSSSSVTVSLPDMEIGVNTRKANKMYTEYNSGHFHFHSVVSSLKVIAAAPTARLLVFYFVVKIFVTTI